MELLRYVKLDNKVDSTKILKFFPKIEIIIHGSEFCQLEVLDHVGSLNLDRLYFGSGSTGLQICDTYHTLD